MITSQPTPGPWPAIMLGTLNLGLQNATRPLFSLYATQIGISTEMVGVLFAAYQIVQLSLAVFAGAAIDRWGARRPAMLGGVLMTLGLTLTVLADSWHLLMVAQVLGGLSHLAIQVSYQSYIGGLPDRERNIGLMTFGASAGQGAGPLLGGVMADAWGYTAAFWVAAAVSLIQVVIALRLPTAAEGGETYREGGGLDLLRKPALVRAMLIGAIVLFTMDLLTTYFPLYGQELGLSASAIGAVLAVRSIFSMAPRPFMARILARLGRQRVIVGSLVVGGLSMAALGMVQSFWALLAVGAVVGLGFGLAQPLTLVLVSEVASAGQLGQAMALRLMGNRVGQTLSPVIFGLLAGSFGLAPVFWIGGGLLAVSYKALAGLEERHA